MRPVRMFLLLWAWGAAVQCGGGGGDDGEKPRRYGDHNGRGGPSTSAADKGTVVKVELGESGSTFFVKPDERQWKLAG